MRYGEAEGGKVERGGDYTDLVVWQRAMDFVDAVSDATENRPRREEYGLSNRVRRPVVSEPANIAGGRGERARERMHTTSRLPTDRSGKSRRCFVSVPAEDSWNKRRWKGPWANREK
jgi:hypothetical protein